MTPIGWILEAGCAATCTTIRQMRGRGRSRWLVIRRAFIVKKMRAEGYSLIAIARELGGRHHTTIMHYLRT